MPIASAAVSQWFGLWARPWPGGAASAAKPSRRSSGRWWGFIAIFFSDAPAAEIAASDLDPLATLDLLRNLSPTRRNGLAATLKAIRTYAAGAARAGENP